MDADLADRLRAAGVPVETWGTGVAKTLDHLRAELAAGESRLDDRDGTLVRSVPGVVLVLYRRDETGGWWWLRERSQRFIDGRVRVRDLDISIGEKRLTGEDAETAARRALSEELGITDTLDLPAPTRHHKRAVSESFPGLHTVYTSDCYTLVLPARLVEESYVEYQADKTTTWSWERLPLPLTSYLDAAGNAATSRR